jgi:hypothetical protein
MATFALMPAMRHLFPAVWAVPELHPWWRKVPRLLLSAVATDALVIPGFNQYLGTAVVTNPTHCFFCEE